MVFGLDNDRVVKVYIGEDGHGIEDMETEREAYRRIKQSGFSSRHVLKCCDLDNAAGLVFERCDMTVRRWVRSRDYAPRREALRLAVEAAKGLEFVHDCGIIQGDVGCHNMLLDANGTLKVADFAGSSVEGCRFPPSVDYDVGSKLPDETEPTIRSDTFALGSTIYEMMTHKAPYKERSYTEVQRLFKQQKFPDDFPEDFEAARGLRAIVEKCWGKGGVSYATAKEVLFALDDLGPVSCSTYVTPTPKKRGPTVVQYDNESSAQPTDYSSTQSNHQSSDPSSSPSSTGKEPPKTTAKSSKKNSAERRNTYVDPNRNRKKSRKHRSDYENIESRKRKHHRHNHSEGPLTHFVHSFQGLLARKPWAGLRY